MRHVHSRQNYPTQCPVNTVMFFDLNRQGVDVDNEQRVVLTFVMKQFDYIMKARYAIDLIRKIQADEVTLSCERHKEILNSIELPSIAECA